MSDLDSIDPPQWSVLPQGPLWETMHEAGANAQGTPADATAAEIRALVEWLFEGRSNRLGNLAAWQMARLKKLLLQQAEIADQAET